MISEQVVIYLVVSPFIQHLQLFRRASIYLSLRLSEVGRIYMGKLCMQACKLENTSNGE